MKKQEVTKKFTKASERAFRIGIRKKYLDEIIDDDNVLYQVAEKLLRRVAE